METLTRFGFVVTASLGKAVIPSKRLGSARDLFDGLHIEILRLRFAALRMTLFENRVQRRTLTFTVRMSDHLLILTHNKTALTSWGRFYKRYRNSHLYIKHKWLKSLAIWQAWRSPASLGYLPCQTIGVWMPRNCPPQIAYSYCTIIIALLFGFVKDFLSAQISVVSFFRYLQKSNN